MTGHSGVARIFVWRGGFVRLTGATGHAHIIRRQIGLCVLFDQYNGAYSKDRKFWTAQGGAHGER